MKLKKFFTLLLSVAMIFSTCAVGVNAAENDTDTSAGNINGIAAEKTDNTSAENITDIVLSDSLITVNGETVTEDSSAAVYTGAEIVYYKDGTDETYGEGSESEMHSAEEAEAHTVVTIAQPGIYRLSGTLSSGQIAIDLGEDAEENPDAVVTIILDNANVTCTVAPALIFYNVYECGTKDTETASPTVDTSAAGANIIIAEDSRNDFNGSHVARIYKEGTTDKLHKYDAAFYSKMSMNIDSENDNSTGVLNIVSDNEGLDSELHLTINGGIIQIDSQDDGINTNEDFVSVTTINGGNITVNGGQGAEGDGIDSNGYLTINGGTVWTTANPNTPDGGIDADGAITINGGTLFAFGTRNDAADQASQQPYMELSFASTLPAGSSVSIKDTEGNELIGFTAEKACQSITFTTPELALDTVYNVYVDDVLQCWSGNSFGMMGGGMGPGGMERPERPADGEIPEGMTPPEGWNGERPEMPEGMTPPENWNGEIPEGMTPPENWSGEMPEGMTPPENWSGERPEMPEGMTPPEDWSGQRPDNAGGQQAGDGSGSTEFTLTETIKSFSGVCDSDASGKTRISFNAEGITRLGRNTVINEITAVTSSAIIAPELVQITVTDNPSEDYSASCLLSDGIDAVNELLPEDDGNYTLTIAVVSGAENYTGATQISFTVGALPFIDVRDSDESYDAIKSLYDAEIMVGTGENTFSPDETVTRAQAITVLARLAGAASAETDDFSDVEKGSWYSGFVGWACANNIVIGDGQGHFMPNDTVTGEHMTLMIERYAKLTNTEYSASESFTGALDRGQLAQMLAVLL